MKTKFKNHLYRIQYNKTLPAPLHSVVLNAVPNDRLMIKDELVNLILSNKDVKEFHLNFKDASNMIDELEKIGCIKQIAGCNLDFKLGL